MHIAIVTETFPPEVNGVAMTLHHLARGMVKLGHRVQVVRPRQKMNHPTKRSFSEITVPGFPLPGYRGLRFGLPCEQKLLNAWRLAPPDVIYVATEGPLGLSAISAARKLGVPLTSGFHTNFTQYMNHYSIPGMSRLIAIYLRWVHNRTWCTYTPSPHTRDTLVRLGLRNVRILGRGVDTALFNPEKRNSTLRQSWKIGPEGVVPLLVSRIASEKNLSLVARSSSLILDHIPGSQAIWVGDGPEKSRLQREFPHFQFAGMRQGNDLASHYASGDLFIFPSMTETFGNVVTEAMASGLIVIAYDYAAANIHIKDGYNGFLAPFGDEQAFQCAVIRALEAREKWPQIRLAARKSAERLSWHAIANQFVNTLNEARKAHHLHNPPLCRSRI